MLKKEEAKVKNAWGGGAISCYFMDEYKYMYAYRRRTLRQGLSLQGNFLQ